MNSDLEKSGEIPKEDCLDAANNLITDLRKELKYTHEMASYWYKDSHKMRDRLLNSLIACGSLAIILIVLIGACLDANALRDVYQKACHDQWTEIRDLKNKLHALDTINDSQNRPEY